VRSKKRNLKETAIKKRSEFICIEGLDMAVSIHRRRITLSPLDGDALSKESVAMSRKPSNHIPGLLMPSPVLFTESAAEFNNFHDALKDELKSRGVLDHLLITDIAELAWEIRRYRRGKASLINSAILSALKKLLLPIIRRQVTEEQAAEGLLPKRSDAFEFHWPTEAELEAESEVEGEADRLAHQWFVDKSAKKQIFEMLRKHKLDEYAIETEAMRIVAPDLERLDRILSSLEWRLNKALRSFADYRSGLGRDLHAAVERVIDGEVLALDNPAKKPP
jgi:hypothetical protein